MAASAERKPRQTFKERYDAGKTYVGVWFDRIDLEALDRIAKRKGSRMQGRSTVIRDLVKRALVTDVYSKVSERERQDARGELQSLREQVAALNDELGAIRAKEQAQPTAFQTPKEKADSMTRFLVVFRLQQKANQGNSLSIDDIEATSATFGIEGQTLIELMNDLEDEGKITRGSYGRFSLNE